jgi:hypothetical protein
VSNADGAVWTTSEVYHMMQRVGLCDSEGVTTLASLAVEARDLNRTTVAFRPYADPPWPGWQSFFAQYAGVAPIVAQVGFGQQLVDMISGDGENANNLRSHFICVLGRNTGGWSARANRNLPAGFWCADGCNFAGGNNHNNNFNAADVLQFYPDSVMGAALPTGALVIKGNGGSTKMAWTRTNAGAQDDRGHAVGAGVANAIFAAGFQGSDGLLGETYYGADDSFTPLANGTVLRYSKATNAVTQDGAHVAVSLFEANTAAQAQIAALNAEIAKLQGGPPPASDPRTEAALALLNSIAAALALPAK